MRINYNVSAGITNKHLLNIEDSLSVSMERLSSGLKINHAKDNPAGMAISNKMQVQIDGLDRASQNASDGISAIQIADGALDEVTSILQRMRELSVQAASDATMSLEDKQAIQAEITSLKDEVDRISNDTEYNTKTLLNGNLDTRVYEEGRLATRIQVSDEVETGEYEFEITKAATQASGVKSQSGFDNATTAVGASGSITINGSTATIDATDTWEEAYEKIRDAAEIGEVDAERNNNGEIEFSSVAYGNDATLQISCSNADMKTLLGLNATDCGWVQSGDSYKYVDTTTGNSLTGSDMVAAAGNGFSSSATVSADGNHVTIKDAGGKEFSFLAKAGTAATLKFDVTDIGEMVLHVGANMDQTMNVKIPEVSTESLYIDDLDVTTVNGASRAISQLDSAIAQVSSVRSRLGAYENRLEYSVDSLDEFGENMTDAISRLTDVDMAEEMSNYTQLNVLNQAAISVLTQANEMPQQILQIMQL